MTILPPDWVGRDPMSVVEPLGLSVSEEHLTDGGKLFERATQTLDEWAARRNTANRLFRRIAEALSLTMDDGQYVPLIEESYRAGLRCWLVSFAAPHFIPMLVRDPEL